MAQEEIKLIGSFKDDITPKLKKLSKEITNIGRAFEKFNRNLRPISREFGRMAASADRFNQSMAQQRSILGANARAMGEYKKQAGKMSGAMRQLESQRQKAARAQGLTRSQQRTGGGGKGGSTIPMPVSPAAGKGTGKAFGASAGASFKQSIGATAIGTSIGMMASQAIMSGVQGLKNLALAPFKKFGAMFSERISDEMDDIKSAGGLFALDMDLTQASGNERFFKNYNAALRFQEKLNIDMAQSAASLPGVTSQYVSTSRQLTDTLQMTMEKDRGKFGELAQQFGGNVVGDGTVRDSQESMRTVLQKMTEQVMLQSQGQQGGLPMHIAIQQLMGKEQGKIKMQAFTNKFRAAFQKNPLLKNFLLRAEEEMNSTAAGSADRLRVIMETFDRAMPKEVINKMRGSISGMQEALRSGLLDPQAGLFGMSRANLLNGQEIMKKNVDDFGNVLYEITSDIGIDDEFAKKLKAIGIDKAAGDTLKEAELTAEQIKKLGFSLDKTGKVIGAGGKEIGKISESSTYIFEQIREILAGYGPVLLEFVGELPGLFDPFGEMTNNLKDFRDNAQKFISGFNSRLDLIEDAALEFTNMADPSKKGVGATLKKQSRGRAAMDTVASYLKGIGAINDDLFQEIRGKAQDFSEAGIANFEKEGFGDAIGKLLKATLESDLMKEFGKIGGIIIGGITKAVVDVIKMITGAAKGQMGNKLTQGFTEGIKIAFGGMDFNEVKGIIGDAAFSIISKGLDIVFTQIVPNLFQMYVGGLFKGLFSGNIVTMILSAIGIAKLAAMIAGPLSMIGSALTFLSPLLISLGGILMTVITTIGSVLAAIAAPVLAVAGAVMIVIAVVRNFGSILKMAGGAIKMIVGEVVVATSKYIGALGNILSWIPGLKGVGEGLKNAGESMKGFGDGLKDQGFTDIKEAGSEMKRQFTQDAEAIKAKFSGMFPKMDSTTMSLAQMSNMIDQNVQSIKAEESARKDARKAVTAFSLQSADTKTQGTTYSGSTYTAGGIEYDAATGLPVSSITGGAMYTGAAAAPAAATTSTTPAAQTSDPSGAKAAMETVETGMSGIASASTPAAEGLKKVGPAAEEATKGFGGLDSAVDTVKTAFESAATTIDGVPPQIETALVGAANSAGQAITAAAQNLAQALSKAAQGIANAAQATSSPGAGLTGGTAFSGHTPGDPMKSLPLAEAIAKERQMMPSGADLMIANTSETVIPAYAGHQGEGFKGFSFAELESAAGFDRMASYTDQIAEMADKTANTFSMGGLLGGGSATLNAMEALGHANGLTTTSGHRPGDPGFHGVNRARDLSNGSGQTPEMDKVANIMATRFGQSLTELIYTPLGFSIKNGAKTGLISPDNHYHHIHVAVAEGLQKAAVFSSASAAEAYERSMMPAGSEPMKVNLASMTANSSEFAGGGNITIGDVNVVVNGADNPREIANEVAEEILQAIKQTSYTEIFSS